MVSNEFFKLNERCNLLVSKYLEPIIQSEKSAIENSLELPQLDFDSFAAFRLLSHAELEGYFEAKAESALKLLDTDFRNKKIVCSKFASLIFLYLIKKQINPKWSSIGKVDDNSIKSADRVDFTNLAQEALGFGRQFIKQNNGIKENSIHILSALMGYFEDELDSVLVAELNQFGISRGKVAHDSWTKDTSTFESADIEKNRLLNILNLIEIFYENQELKPHIIEPTFMSKLLKTIKLK